MSEKSFWSQCHALRGGGPPFSKRQKLLVVVSLIGLAKAIYLRFLMRVLNLRLDPFLR